MTKAIIFMIVATTHIASAAPKSVLWDIWLTHSADSNETIDHMEWDDFLGRYVSYSREHGMNLFRYSDVTEMDKSRLKMYIKRMSEVDIGSLNRDVQQAFWINLYNAATVDLVLDHYPISSIRRINLSGLFSGPWNKKILTVDGTDVSLNDIEHRILRPIWEDPRNHYALNCASIGCPQLQKAAFTSDNLESLLEQAAAEYLSHPRGFSIDGSRLTLSSIFDWFADDFGGTRSSILDHIAGYVSEEVASSIESWSGRIRYTYDWSLNEP